MEETMTQAVLMRAGWEHLKREFPGLTNAELISRIEESGVRVSDKYREETNEPNA